MSAATRICLLIGCAAALLGCGGADGGGFGGLASTPAPVATTSITVAGDAENRYPTMHVRRVDCGNSGAADAFVSFLLPPAPAPSAIRDEMMINVTGTRVTALNALYTLFTAPNSEAVGRSGSVGPVKLQSTGVKGQDGTPMAPGMLTVSGTYICR